jgi:hypothetical protein
MSQALLGCSAVGSAVAQVKFAESASRIATRAGGAPALPVKRLTRCRPRFEKTLTLAIEKDDGRTAAQDESYREDCTLTSNDARKKP